MPITRADKIEWLKSVFEAFFTAACIEDANPELDLKNTPERAARMYVDELLAGYDEKAVHQLEETFTIFNSTHVHEMVVIRGTYFTSLCGHHLMPFYGTVDFGYIPTTHVIGLSKFPRLVKLFSARLQTQENFTAQLANFVMSHVNPVALVVLTRAHHLCCSARGIRQPGVEMVTSAIRGEMTASMKAEFYNLLDRK